jgi:hypothetical protein
MGPLLPLECPEQAPYPIFKKVAKASTAARPSDRVLHGAALLPWGLHAADAISSLDFGCLVRQLFSCVVVNLVPRKSLNNARHILQFWLSVFPAHSGRSMAADVVQHRVVRFDASAD